MVKLQIWVKDDTSLKHRLGSIIKGAYAFENMIFDEISKNKLSYSYESKLLGKTTLTIYTDYIDVDSCIADIYVDILAEDYTHNDLYELCNMIEDDNTLIAFIKTKLVEYANSINESIKSIQFPVKENFIFDNDRYYIESSIYNNNHTIEWYPIALGTDENGFIFKEIVPT